MQMTDQKDEERYRDNRTNTVGKREENAKFS
jgi:hypothetical protein